MRRPTGVASFTYADTALGSHGRGRPHALLDFLASKLIRRKSQQVWLSEATRPQRARRRSHKEKEEK
jgi:hypothetical protein